ncbi:hypothetical protein C8Q74DRAFT_1288967 [Fomes fomentarius]|nr:hypothetical protein C8Q74DRAFT_1288967 [Fomes fomentarius]
MDPLLTQRGSQDVSQSRERVKRARHRSPSPSTKHDLFLQQVYDQAWGKRWPSKTCTISRDELGLDTDLFIGVDSIALPGDDVPDRGTSKVSRLAQSTQVDIHPDHVNAARHRDISESTALEPGSSLTMKVNKTDAVVVGGGGINHDLAPIPDEWEYTCLLDIRPLMEVIGGLSITSHEHPTTTIVIRDDYATLLKALEGSKHSFVVTGQSGIGKSIFLIYLLIYRLERCLPTAIDLTGYNFILFSAGGVTVHNPKRDSWCLTEDCWALSDSNACVSQPCQAFRSSRARVIQTTPPQPHRWKEWRKQMSASVAIADLPTLFEIAAVAKEDGLSPVDAIATARKWGPCIRGVLSILYSPHGDSMRDDQVRRAVLALHWNPSAVLLGEGPRVVHDSVEDLLFLRRWPDNLGLSWISAPTPYLAQLLDEARCMMDSKKLVELDDLLRRPAM